MTTPVGGRDIPSAKSQCFNVQSNEISCEKNQLTLKIQRTLEKCENYFIFWLGDSNLEVDTIAAKINQLYEIIGRVDDDSEDETDDEVAKITNQNPDDTKEQTQNLEINTRNVEGDLKHDNEPPNGKSKNYSESTDDEVSEDESGLHPYVTQRVAAILIESFVNIQFGGITMAKKQLSLCKKFKKFLVENHNSMQDFVPGFDFLCTRLEMNLRLKEIPNDFDDMDLKSISCDDFIGLSDKSKSIVYAAKWMFLELLDNANRNNESLEALEKVTNLDDSNHNWNYLLCMRLRSRRRELHGAFSKPDKKEINASVASVEMSQKLGGTFHAMSRAGLCQTISDDLRGREFDENTNVPITFGKLTFESDDAIIKYLKKEARSVLCRFPRICFAEYMRYAEIFSTGLPREHRNYEIAMLCMSFCLRLMPNNSKAHHKMGILHLVGEKDVKEAIRYFRNAITLAPTNFPAWMDLIQSLLQSHLEYADDLDTIFLSKDENIWNANQAASFKFLEGCYFFLKKEKNKAIETWVAINSTSASEEGLTKYFFRRSAAVKRRYLWPESAMKLEEIQKAIHDKMQPEDVPNNVLQVLEDEIKTIRIFQYRPIKINPQGNGESGPHYFSNAGNVGKYFHNSSESNKDVWRLNCSAAAAAEPSSRSEYENSSGRTNFQRGGINSHSSRYDYRQRRRSPSPANWRN